VDATEIESLCQYLEDLFASWKRDENIPARATFDPAHRALDAIASALSVPKPPGAAPASPLPAQESIPAVPVPAQRIFASEDTVRISVAKLDARLVEAEEMLTAKLITSQRVEDLRELARPFEAWRSEWTAAEADVRALHLAFDRPAPGQLPNRSLARLLEFFDQNLDHLKSIESSVAALILTAEQDRLAIGKLVDELLEDSKNLLLLPSATLTASFPKLVRDLCHDLGKEANLVIHGEEVEIDKRILEQMKDPLIHLLRNCVDHGIEAPERRVQLDKPACGTITLTVSRVSGGKVEILVSDDGAGIDTEKVKESAIKHGFLSADDARRMGDSEARALIFQAEVSTSPMITRLSGRGLGLAIVREQAEKLGGTVAVEIQPRQGTRFRLLLPSLLATFRGVLIEVAGRVFVVPTAHVECVAQVRPAEIQMVEGRETIALSGSAVSLVWLADLLALPRADLTDDPSAAPILVLGVGEQRVAFAVDAILDEQEVLVKPLRKPLSRVRNIAGATVLGSGRVAPILNVVDLLKSARKSGGGARVAAVTKPAETGAKRLLVVEDSITSRMLLKGILESAGYKVKTAVDGLEAFTLLRAEKFDLLVSDVEMPRLNGFDLTMKIRADKKLSELPIVLVTALESREDRERGVDVGASAYLVKSSFDQSNLLDAVRRLV
jgi:two-component system chemotaxis sensor kinase CheA